jgi:sugar O-acyltransferase (sialic acid O-acetyltransferase NeuD family)
MFNSLAPGRNRANPLIVIGAGGHAVSVANVAISAGYNIEYFVDSTGQGGTLLGVEIIGDLTALGAVREHEVCVAIGDNAAREKIHRELSERYGSLIFPTLIHSSAVISSFTNIDEGTVVMPNAVVGPNARIGKFCIVNSQASIDHDGVLADYSSLAPGAITGGRVMIGIRSAVCIGAVIKHGVHIGDDCVVGANSYLNKDLSSNQMAYGTPAAIVRSRNVGDPYLK